MPSYRRLGQLPAKRHIQLRRPVEESHLGEGIDHEHVVTSRGFSGAYAILYHLRPPTRVVRVEHVGRAELVPAEELPLRHHHLKTAGLPRAGDPLTGRVPLLFNDDVICYRCRPAEPQADLFRNGAADEIVFIHRGEGTIETSFGCLPYRRGDYVVLPRMTTYRMVPKDIAAEDYFVLECDSPVQVPPRYLNDDGQIRLGAPYYERDFHSPLQADPIDDASETPLIIKDGPRLTRTVMAHHPLDVVGWDGFLYPYTFNAWDFEPLTGTVHLPPPFQQTFECRGFVVCTFAPRYLDHHPEAIKVPYAHSNVQADEVLFYVDGQFGSRRGVESGSITLHPGGIPHGPHPGTIVASRVAERTEEMAVMFDTDKPLHLTRQALDFDDPSYPLSWLE